MWRAVGRAILGVLAALPRLLRLFGKWRRERRRRASDERVRKFREAVGRKDTAEAARRLDDLLRRARRDRRFCRLPPKSGVPPR